MRINKVLLVLLQLTTYLVGLETLVIRVPWLQALLHRGNEACSHGGSALRSIQISIFLPPTS